MQHILPLQKLTEHQKLLKLKILLLLQVLNHLRLPFIKIDKERIITSTEALKLKEVPKHLVIIGGGVIGIELGQVYLRLGAQVSVVEFMDRIIPGMDAALV